MSQEVAFARSNVDRTALDNIRSSVYWQASHLSVFTLDGVSGVLKRGLKSASYGLCRYYFGDRDIAQPFPIPDVSDLSL